MILHQDLCVSATLWVINSLSLHAHCVRDMILLCVSSFGYCFIEPRSLHCGVEVMDLRLKYSMFLG